MVKKSKDIFKILPFEESAIDYGSLFSQYEAAMRGYIETAFGWDCSFQRQRFAESYDKSDIKIIFVGEEMAGFAVIKNRQSPIHLSLLILKPNFQRQGIGRSVVAEIISTVVQDKSCLTLSCFRSNHGAIAFYESMGFVAVSTEDYFINYSFPPYIA